MKKIWIISDTHFNHPAIIEYENRPIDYQKQIIRKWNNNIGDNDIVFHLGDVIFDNASELKNINSKLKGFKILIRGNHDKKSVDFYMNKGFNVVLDEVRVRYLKYNILLTHKPQTPLEKGIINIHGHCHTKGHLRTDLTNRHILYSLEFENYMPILLQNIIKRYDKEKD